MWANEKATGRNWSTADKVTMTNFGDCCRANFYWTDGAESYFIEDTKQECVDHLASMGFSPSAA